MRTKNVIPSTFLTIFATLTLSLVIFLNSEFAIAKQPQVSISGISSGGFMAVQMGTIFSSEFSGVGSVAGGFFYCAQNHLQDRIFAGAASLVGSRNLFLFAQSEDFYNDATAPLRGQKINPSKWFSPARPNPIYMSVGVCMQNPKESDQPNLELMQITSQIEPVSHVAQQKIFIYQGANDSVVKPDMATELIKFYTNLKVPPQQLKYVSRPGGHNFPTDKEDLNSCDAQAVPYISSCKYNLAQDLLKHLLSIPLKKSAFNPEQLFVIDQNLDVLNKENNAFDSQPAMSIAPYGYLYSSQSCLDKPETCRLHVALHGCEMSDSFDKEFDEKYSAQIQKTLNVNMFSKMGDSWFNKNEMAYFDTKVNKMGTLKFAMQSGYADYAEENNLMVLFPQTWITENNYPYNPKGCWDWFGWTNRDYATKKGLETSWLMNYIQEIKAHPKKFIMNQKPAYDKLK
jgi:hypothetical protein